MSSDELGPKSPGAGYKLPDLGDLADETASLIELTGAIKWFDVSKGYGFFIPDNGLPDVLLHVTCLSPGLDAGDWPRSRGARSRGPRSRGPRNRRNVG